MTTRYLFPYKVYSLREILEKNPHPNCSGFIPAYEDIPTLVADHTVTCECGTFKAEREPPNPTITKGAE